MNRQLQLEACRKSNKKADVPPYIHAQLQVQKYVLRLIDAPAEGWRSSGATSNKSKGKAMCAMLVNHFTIVATRPRNIITDGNRHINSSTSNRPLIVT